MSTPDFITAIRAAIGHRLLLLPGVAGVVMNPAYEVLLVRRTETDSWIFPGGIVEPGEEPATTVVREVAEETGLIVIAERIVAVTGRHRLTYANGDECEFVTTMFRCSIAGGALKPDGVEINDARFFPTAHPAVAAYLASRNLPPTIFDEDQTYFTDQIGS